MLRALSSRLALFAALCATLLAAALLFSASGEREAPAAPATAVSAAPRLPPAARAIERRAAGAASTLRRAARRFLAAFLRYEVGERGRAVDGDLRAASTPRFAAALLARPPRALSPAGYPRSARLGPVGVTFLSARADRALVRSSALREGGAEQLSFVFERRRGRWLAAGPGQ